MRIFMTLIVENLVIICYIGNYSFSDDKLIFDINQKVLNQ